MGISDNDSVTVWSIWTVDGRVCGGVSRRYLARRNRRSARSSRSLVAPSDDAGAPHPYPSRTHRYIYPPLTPHDSTPPPLSLHTTKQPGDRPPTPRRNIRRLRSSPRHGPPPPRSRPRLLRHRHRPRRRLRLRRAHTPRYKFGGRFDVDAVHRLLVGCLEGYGERVGELKGYREWIEGQGGGWRGAR